jgi:hypothetical protein
MPIAAYGLHVVIPSRANRRERGEKSCDEALAALQAARNDTM